MHLSRVASMATFIWRTWGRFQHLYKQGQYYELYLQMTKQIKMTTTDSNSVKSVYALTARLHGCSVYPSSYNKYSTSESAKKPENRLSQTLSRNRNLAIWLGLSRVLEKKKYAKLWGQLYLTYDGSRAGLLVSRQLVWYPNGYCTSQLWQLLL